MLSGSWNAFATPSSLQLADVDPLIARIISVFFFHTFIRLRRLAAMHVPEHPFAQLMHPNGIVVHQQSCDLSTLRHLFLASFDVVEDGNADGSVCSAAGGVDDDRGYDTCS